MVKNPFSNRKISPRPTFHSVSWFTATSRGDDFVSKVGAYLNAAMKDAFGAHPNVGDIRGEGMLCALEFVEDRDSRTFFDPADKVAPRIAAALVSEGVIGRAMPQGDILGFTPPLCLSNSEVDEIVDKTRAAIASVLAE